ncbi:MAG: hypothetical protein AAFY15_13195 [Cyanobacteria bacterium J06648_11]
MPRKLNPLCKACCLLSAEEARSRHGQGSAQPCWDENRCHDRRSYYRLRHDKNRSHRIKRQEDLLPTPEIAIVVPETISAVLTLYGSSDSRKGAGLVQNRWRTAHAIAAQLWRGQEAIAKIPTVHTLHLSQRQWDGLLAQILQQFSQFAGEPVMGFNTIREWPMEKCPLKPCPLVETDI